MTQSMSPYPPAGPGYYPPSPPPQNGFGVTAFVLGLLGLLFSFIPLIGIIAWPMVILALVFGGLGLSRARAGRATNKGLTIAGVVCALLGLLICILYAAMFSAAVSSTPTTAPQATTNAAPAQAGTGAGAGIGDAVQDGSFTFTVTEVETGVQALGDSFLRTEAQGEFVLVHVTVTNVGSESATFIGGNQTLLDAQGREFTADSSAAAMSLPGSESLFTPINPGNKVDGVLVFDVPEGLTPAAIELHQSMFSDGALVSLAG